MSGLLKFITCGSVDDGKSTLIGHILYDSKLLYADQEKALELDSKVGSRGGAIDYSLLLDGLRDMRSTQETWQSVHPLQTLPLSLWMQSRACSYRPEDMQESVH